MKKLILFWVILIVFFESACIAFAASPQINEGSYILIDAKSGDVLYEKDANKKGLYPASTTKIMTAILAIKMGKPDQVMTASSVAVDDVGRNGTNIGIMAGEKITLEYLLKALLISSANETANIIAENICNSRQEFVDLMNQKAQQLGAVNTHFMNPCGAHNPNHYSTAADFAKIARYAMTIPKFREIVNMDSFQMPPTNKHEYWPVLATTNKLMQRDKSEIYEINGIKSGYTGPAGFNLVASAKNAEGMELISVMMDIKGDNGQSNIKLYSKRLLDYGFNNYSLTTLIGDKKVYRSIVVEDANDSVPLELITKGYLKYVLPNDANSWDVTEIPHIADTIIAPIKEGERVGYVDFQRNGQSIGIVDIVASRSVMPKLQIVNTQKLKSFSDYTIVKITLFVISILLFFLLLRAVLKKISRTVNSRKQLGKE